MNVTQLSRNLAPASSVISRPLAMLMITLLFLALVPSAVFAQTTATWRVEVWEQDDGGPYDQFAPFCQDPAGTPCTGVTGVQICVDGLVNCQSTSGSPSTAVFTGLSLASHTACLVDPDWLVVSGSAGAPVDGPNCVTRDFGADPEGQHDHATAMYVELNVFEVTVTKEFTEAHPVADSEVEITLTCDAGSISTVDPNAVMEELESPTGGGFASKLTESGSATFWVTGTANCYATEVVPPGYVQTDSTCGDEMEPGIVLPSDEPIGCTITNRPTEATFTVDKQFSDGNPILAASITTACEEGVPGPGLVYADPGNSGQATESTDFVTTIKWFGDNTVCHASETDLVGYTEVSPPPSGNTCTSDNPIDDENDNSCVIYNDQDPIEIHADKIYSSGGGSAVNFAVECTNLDTGGSVTPSTDSASPGNPAIFTVNDVKWDGSTTCTVSEPVAPGGYWETDNTCTAENLDMTPNSDDPRTCAITNSPTRATFRVTKQFADGNNVDEVTVSIDCNTGLILDQDKDLADNEEVEFVVTDFTDGLLECTITEDGQAGYSGEYDNVSLGNILSDDSCEYASETITAETSAHVCVITNSPDPQPVVITKEWVFEGTSSPSDLDTFYQLVLHCDGLVIVDGNESCGLMYQTESAQGSNGSSLYGCKFFQDDAPRTFEALVVPEFPSSNCWIEEHLNSDFVEVTNDCQDIVVSAGQGDSCTITNTVFFEGIPTLSQYGMAIMALLMLGVGLVGFRRFS